MVAVTGDWWLEDWEKAILDFHAENLLKGYRPLALIMLNAYVVAISPSNVLPGIQRYRHAPDGRHPACLSHIKQDPGSRRSRW